MRYFILFLLTSSYFLHSRCEYQLVWADEFDGTSLDTSAWNIDTGDQWYNNELEAYKTSNVIVKDGTLQLVAKKENYLSKSYTSGRINTESKKVFTYGRFEARMKFPTGKGFWPAFWLYPENYNTNDYREIDIMEAVGDLPNTIFSTCWGGPESNLVSAGLPYTLKANYDQDFHVYYAEWKPGSISFGVDNTTFFTCSPNNMKVYSYDNLATAKFNIILNLAVGGDWPGSPSSTTVFPSTMYVDYVRVYQDNSASSGGSVTPTPSTVTQATSCTSYSSSSLKNGILYWVGVGKCTTSTISVSSTSSKSACCNLCGTTPYCIALKYSSGSCTLLAKV